MPDWNLGNLMSYGTKRVGHRADLDVSDVSFFANQAMLDFAYDVPESLSEKKHYFSVNSGTSQSALPDDFQEVITISFDTTAQGSARTLQQISPEYADAHGWYPHAEPQGYFVFNDEMNFWPSADSSANTTAWSGRSYLMRYAATPSDMTDTAHVPSITTEHRYGVLLKLEVYLHQFLGNLEEASISEARYTSYVAKLKDNIAKRQAARSRFAVSFPEARRRTTGSREEDYPWLKY